MASEDSKDMLKNMDWKTLGNPVTVDSSSPSTTKKRLPKKIRQVPEYYFLPRRSLPATIAIYGAACAAGVGAGMLLEVWINKKIKDPLWFIIACYSLYPVYTVCSSVWWSFSNVHKSLVFSAYDRSKIHEGGQQVKTRST